MALSTLAIQRLVSAIADISVANELIAAINDAILTGTVLTSNNTFSGTNTFTGALTVTDVNVALSTDTGTKIGTAAGQKLAFHGATPTDQPAAMTAQLTTITPADAEGTPDYAIAAVTNVAPFGFASA